MQAQYSFLTGGKVFSHNGYARIKQFACLGTHVRIKDFKIKKKKEYLKKNKKKKIQLKKKTKTKQFAELPWWSNG